MNITKQKTNSRITRILVVTEKYPTKNTHSMYYVHTRNLFYKKKGINVDVISFSTTTAYNKDGITVYPATEYKTLSRKNYALLILHAPNIKHHYRFVKKYGKNFEKILIVFHGHEILRIRDSYPEPYKWNKKRLNPISQQLYDSVKFFLCKKMILDNSKKIHLIFVSNWLYPRFLYNVHINPNTLDGKVSIIHNSIGTEFEQRSYDKTQPKKYDFITIRGASMDDSKYGIDIVTKIAKQNPNYKFLVIGTGNFYKHVKKPNNITHVSSFVDRKEILSYINEARCALMPTKEDTQGVMTCELIGYGIPTITSNIEICREIFGGVKNIFFIDNNSPHIKLGKIYSEIQSPKVEKNTSYNAKNTLRLEAQLIERLVNE